MSTNFHCNFQAKTLRPEPDHCPRSRDQSTEEKNRKTKKQRENTNINGSIFFTINDLPTQQWSDLISQKTDSQ